MQSFSRRTYFRAPFSLAIRVHGATHVGNLHFAKIIIFLLFHTHPPPLPGDPILALFTPPPTFASSSLGSCSLLLLEVLYICMKELPAKPLLGIVDLVRS